MLPFNRRKHELSVQDDCVLWGNRVVVPKQGQHRVLEQLHQSHPGTVRMKSLAHTLVWWPGIDADIEAKVKACKPCQKNTRNPPKSPLQPWKWPEQTWSHLHIDHAG